MAYDEHRIVAVAIERMSDKIDRMDSKIEVVQQDVNKFIILFEKLAHIEKTHEENNKRVHHRIDELENQIEKCEYRETESGCPVFQKWVSTHDNELKHNIEKIKSCEDFKKEVETDLKNIELKPAKLFDSAVMTIITVAVASIVGFMMAKLGLKG